MGGWAQAVRDLGRPLHERLAGGGLRLGRDLGMLAPLLLTPS